MRNSIYAATGLLLLACAAAPKADSKMKPAKERAYPAAPQAELVEILHGVPVADPYRPLEDPDAPAVRTWIGAQNELLRAKLDPLPGRVAIRERLTELWNYERFGLPVRRGARWFFTRNDGLQNQNVLFVGPSPEASGAILLDPNTLSADGTVALAGTAVTRDGSRLAYGLARSGSDWQEWRVRDVATGADLPDRISWVKFSVPAWRNDGTGFYYSRYDEPRAGAEKEEVNRFQKLCFHRLGDPQSADRVIYERPDQPDWGFGGETTEDGRFLIIPVWVGTSPKNGMYVLDLAAPDAKPLPLLTAFDAKYDFVGSDGDVLYFLTDADAPRGRLIAVDQRRPDKSSWRTVVPQADATLLSAGYVGGRFFASYLRDACSEVRVFTAAGADQGVVPLPGKGTATGFGGSSDDVETFYTFAGYARPGEIVRYEIATGRTSVLRRPKLAFDPERFLTEQIFATSKDGTKVPMFVTRLKDLKPDGERPTYLYGYGGFNVSLTPSFSPAHVVWLERGGVYVEANLRGGAEYGEAWHEAGTKLKKQNVFDDFAAAAEELVRAGYTTPDRLAIGGHSNGGLLVGASITQRPELFGAAICGVGVLDMLRFHKFTIGWAWTSDYGSPDDPAEFAALRAYSPYHNLKTGTRYPAVMITTADHDDRVVPAHSFKFAAALQAAQATDGPPILIRIDVKAGHGAGKPVAKQIDEWVDVWSFLGSALAAE